MEKWTELLTKDILGHCHKTDVMHKNEPEKKRRHSQIFQESDLSF